MTPERVPVQPPPLSPAGAARRDGLLADLTTTMRRIHRRRVTARRAGVLALVALLGAAAMLIPNPPPRPQFAGAAQPAPPPALQSAPRRAADVAIVSTDPAVLDRYVIDDEQLLATLALLDRPAGLIRSRGHAWLTADVTD